MPNGLSIGDLRALADHISRRLLSDYDITGIADDQDVTEVCFEEIKEFFFGK